MVEEPVQYKEYPVLDKIWVGAVNYLNTKPMLHGLEDMPGIHLVLDYPSKLVERLASGELDVALVPVIALNTLPRSFIISPYCIASDGYVASVALFSHEPLENIEEIYLDYQSRTSVMLCRILCKEFWKKEVRFLPAGENYISEIGGRKAGVIIGDRALKNLEQFPFKYDLSEEWKKYTGLPFVFACWVTQGNLPDTFLLNFNNCLKRGLQQMDAVISGNQKDFYNMEMYYKKNISFLLDDEKHKAIRLFRSLARDMGE